MNRRRLSAIPLMKHRRTIFYLLGCLAPVLVWLAIAGHHRALSGPDRCAVRVVDGRLEMLDERPFELIVAASVADVRRLPSSFDVLTLTHRARLNLPGKLDGLSNESETWSPKNHEVWYQLFASQDSQLPYRCEPVGSQSK